MGIFKRKEKPVSPQTVRSDYLPVGSVVRLKGEEQMFLVIGIEQTDDDGSIYDYISVLYPYGYVGDDHRYFFNHRNIDQILFRGFDSPEQQDFMNQLRIYHKENNLTQRSGFPHL